MCSTQRLDDFLDQLTVTIEQSRRLLEFELRNECANGASWRFYYFRIRSRQTGRIPE